MDASILHVDLDAFYASVEQLDDATVRGRPVIVGGLGPRGVVAAASYEARRFGVHSAMPMARARRACPDGVFLSPRFDRYQELSRAVMEILRSCTPLVEPISLDEAFLDVAGARRSLGTGPAIGARVRARIRAETGLTASVGVATTKLVAKLASEEAKPDGLFVVEPGTELAFLHPLDVGRLWGVGPATRRRLAPLGVRTVGDLARVDEAELVARLGPSAGGHLHHLAWNRDDRGVVPGHEVKSVGHEETFPVDLASRADLEHELVGLADRVAGRLRKADRAGRTVVLKVRYGNFRTITRSRTLPAPTDLAHDIAVVARTLLDGVPVERGVRLLGVSVHKLVTTGATLPLAGDQAEAPGGAVAPPGDARRAALERSMDAVRARFGSDAIGPGARRRERPAGAPSLLPTSAGEDADPPAR